MTHRRAIALITLIACLSSPSAAQAAFVWSPQTGWIGPSGVVRDNPADQLEYAKHFFDAKDYKRALTEFKKLVKHYKNSHEAAEAQFYIGRCYEEMGDLYKAFVNYRKTIQVYPSTSRFDEVLERMYEIGNAFLAGKKRKLLGTLSIMPARDKAVEVFQAIVEDGPFSSTGELAQYKLGLAHLALGEYEQAVTAFEQLISRYPNSPLVDDARFQLTQASLKGTFRPGYDQHPSEQAVDELEQFVNDYPKSDLAPEALERLKVLQERRAEHDFQVAKFYEQRHKLPAAKLYYQDLIDRFPDTSWAPKAASRLQILEQRLP